MHRRAALAGLFAFVAIVVAEHALEPALGPDRHTISEYANTVTGALMTTGFLAWALSLLATAAIAWRTGPGRCHPRARVALAVLFAISAAGLVLTACFATQTSAGVLPPGTARSTGGRIHDIASGAAMDALVVAVVASIAGLWPRPRFRVLAGTMLAIAVVATAVLLSIGDPVDGIRQRVLVAAGCAWQLALVLALTTSPSTQAGEAVSRT